ncbi:MAG: MFS transporter [Cycloclasticus sp. symbiont of Poecilosclerida sp. M]|nr:MAG: MFS transporter [Cycloclasticus sp. symbiont of Poecilosclerida sp. M]
MVTLSPRFKVLSSGVFCLMLTLGIARFAYTPLLPIMFEQTHLNAVSGGWLATINYLGYMSGALTTALIGSLIIKDRLYRLGLVLSIATTLMMGFSESIWLWSVSRYIAGFATAAGLLMGSGLLLNWLIRHGYRSEMGIHFSGVGLGIALVALLIGGLKDVLSWSQLWWMLGLVAVLLAIPAWRWLPKPDISGVTQAGEILNDQPPSKRFLWLMMFVYFCGGFGFVISATYIVAIVEGQTTTQGSGELAFLMLGLVAAPASILWDILSRKAGILNALMLAYLLHALGIILPTLGSASYFGFLSAILYGFTFIGIVSIVLTLAGRFYPTKPAKLMGLLTMSYGIPQIIAPTIAGYLAQQSGNYYDALYMAWGFVVLGIFAILAIKKWAEDDIKKLA